MYASARKYAGAIDVWFAHCQKERKFPVQNSSDSKVWQQKQTSQQETNSLLCLTDAEIDFLDLQSKILLHLMYKVSIVDQLVRYLSSFALLREISVR